MPTWVQLVYLACAICFILALKGLSGPRTARAGNLLGAAAAVVAVVLASVNMVGGFVVTDRMLQMFRGRRRPGPEA